MLTRSLFLTKTTSVHVQRFITKMASTLLNGKTNGHIVERAPSPRIKDNGGPEEEKTNEKKGLFSPEALTVVVAWYVVSFLVLLINKHVLTNLKGDAVLLSCIQMVVLTILSYFQIHNPCEKAKVVQKDIPRPPGFLKNNMIVGGIRFMTVFMGILALRYTTISFTETVKSSAPIFTVGISRLMLGEMNGPYVICSLVPIMLGLALCSTYELSFNMQGFVAALANNFFECMQFVYSKLLISGDDKFKYTPAEFQFYTGLASTVVQIPCCVLLIDIASVWHQMTLEVFLLMVIDGALYHVQTLLAFMLMSYISPVTHSVVNVVKRAFMIWGSVLVLGNPVTFLSGLGTCVVFLGVLVYNRARDFEQKHRAPQLSISAEMDPCEKDAAVRHL